MSNNMSPLQELQAKIIKAIPSIKVIDDDNGYRDIYLEDVLIACPKNHRLQVDSNGDMEVEKEHNEYSWFPGWLLNTPLHLQSEGTISAINKLIK